MTSFKKSIASPNSLPTACIALFVCCAMTSESNAQCQRSGSSGNPTTMQSATSPIASAVPFTGSNRYTNSPYDQRMVEAYQRQNAMYAMARQLAARQAMSQAIRNAQLMPQRIARAAELRAKRAARTSERLRARGQSSSNDAVAFVTVSDH